MNPKYEDYQKRRIEYTIADKELSRELSNWFNSESPKPQFVDEMLHSLSKKHNEEWVLKNFDLAIDLWENKTNNNLNFELRKWTFDHFLYEKEPISKSFKIEKNENTTTQVGPSIEKRITTLLLSLKDNKYFNLKNISQIEIAVFSVVLGAFASILLGYTFGSSQELGYTVNSPHPTHSSMASTRYYTEFHYNYLIAFSSFIIVSGITYLFLIFRKRVQTEKLNRS